MTTPVIAPSTCPPSLAPTASPEMTRRLLESGAAMWSAAARGAAGYWSGAIARGSSPLDLALDAARFWQLTNQRSRLEWASPNEVVRTWPVARLRDFSAGSSSTAAPTLVLPPQAGHDSCIVDYSVEQSQMKVIRAAGLERAFSLDWIGATADTKDAGIVDYLIACEEAVEHIGEPVNLIGDCQGGWLAAIFAALHPDRVHTLTLAGAPIDFHAGNPVIGDYVDLLGRDADLAFYRGLVQLGGGVLKGEHMLSAFVAIKPESEFEKHVQLLAEMHDEAHVERHRAFEDWYKHTQDIPGALYLWIVKHLFRDNELISGELQVGDERVDLGRIRCPLFLLAGATDHITPPAQVFAAADAVATPAARIMRSTTGGGHLGLFMGREALSEHWPPILARVFERSERRARRAPAERRARASVPAPREPAVPTP